MTKILLAGLHPPSFYKGIRVEAAHYRTWQFLDPLMGDGHNVCLCVEPPQDPVAPPVIPETWSERLEYHVVPFGQSGWRNRFQKIHDDFNPDCIVAVNFYPCLYVTRLRTDRPVWMDIYGDMLTILQASAFRARSNRGIRTTVDFMNQVLRFGDIFSVCGMPQHHMLVGELAMAERLQFETHGYPFVRVILPGASPSDTEPTDQKPRRFLKQYGIKDQDFVVLWCGGYNTWTDTETLFAGLESAMAQDPCIHFVSVGASTYQASNDVYTQFLTAIEHSPFQDRFHMLGWRPWDEVIHYYRESNVGLNIDAMHYETIYGTRTRLLEMIAAGLPAITSLGSELSYLLRDENAALGFETGDWRGLSANILSLSQDPQCTHSYAQNAYRAANERFSFQETTRPLRLWVREPEKSPDRTGKNFAGQMKNLEHNARALLRQALWQITGAYK